VKDEEKQEAMWEGQHELAADLGGFFLKVMFILITLLCTVL
jgi:hypothetical protein